MRWGMKKNVFQKENGKVNKGIRIKRTTESERKNYRYNFLVGFTEHQKKVIIWKYRGTTYQYDSTKLV